MSWIIQEGWLHFATFKYYIFVPQKRMKVEKMTTQFLFLKCQLKWKKKLLKKLLKL